MDNFVTQLIYNEVDTWNHYIMGEVVKSIFSMLSEKDVEEMLEELNESLFSYDKPYRIRAEQISSDPQKEPTNE